jgi:hypothetical protein
MILAFSTASRKSGVTVKSSWNLARDSSENSNKARPSFNWFGGGSKLMRVVRRRPSSPLPIVSNSGFLASFEASHPVSTSGLEPSKLKPEYHRHLVSDPPLHDPTHEEIREGINSRLVEIPEVSRISRRTAERRDGESGVDVVARIDLDRADNDVRQIGRVRPDDHNVCHARDRPKTKILDFPIKKRGS